MSDANRLPDVPTLETCTVRLMAIRLAILLKFRPLRLRLIDRLWRNLEIGTQIESLPKEIEFSSFISL